MRIPGVPVWLKVVRFGYPADRDSWIGTDGLLYGGSSCAQRLVVAPDNAYAAMDLKALSIPEGWERDGVDPSDDVPEAQWWFRVPKDGEAIVGASRSGLTHLAEKVSTSLLMVGIDRRRIILRRKKQFRKLLVVECEEPWHNGTPGELKVTFHGQTLTPTAWRIENREVAE